MLGLVLLSDFSKKIKVPIINRNQFSVNLFSFQFYYIANLLAIYLFAI